MVLLSRNEWLFTVLSILIVTGYTYTLDWPQALETPLREPPYNFSTFQFNMLYFAALLPVGLLGIAIGITIDRIPLPISIMVITLLGFVAQLTIAMCFLTMFTGFYALLIALRAVYGLTGEGAYTIQAVVVQKLGGENYDVMMGLCLTIPLFFDALNSFVTTTLYDATLEASVPLFVCAGMCFMSVIVGCILIFKVKKLDKENLESGKKQIHAEEQFSCQHVKKFDRWFWLIVLMIFVCESALGPFLDNATDLLVKRFNFSYVTAGRLMMLPFGLTPVMSLVWSKLFVGKYPTKRRLFFIITGLQALIPHVILYVMPNNPPNTSPVAYQYVSVIIALSIFSLSFAGFCSVMIPSISLIVEEKSIGTAFSAVGSASSLSQALMPIFNSLVIDQGAQLANNYRNLSLLYGCMAIVTILLCIFLHQSTSRTMMTIDNSDDDLKAKLLISTTSSFSGLQEDISLTLNLEPDEEPHTD